jgi:hypothetical protein
MSTNTQVLNVFEDCVQKLEAYLGVERTPVDFSALWAEKSPHQSSETFDEYFHKVTNNSLLPLVSLTLTSFTDLRIHS